MSGWGCKALSCNFKYLGSLGSGSQYPIFIGKIGAPLAHLPEPLFPPTELLETIEFCHTPLFKDKSFLQQKYIAERLPPAEIARLCFSARSTVMKYLRLFEIPLRRGDLAKTRSQLGYGETWRHMQVTAHKKELGLVEKMQRLRTEGLSYWKIADVLNAWKIPTKTRKGPWSAKQVHQILARVSKKP